MPNKHYMKGYRKERRVVNQARELGHIAFRSAGSHSPIDVIVVDQVNRTIDLIQCKSDKMTDSAKTKILQEQEGIDGDYKVAFTVV